MTEREMEETRLKRITRWRTETNGEKTEKGMIKDKLETLRRGRIKRRGTIRGNERRGRRREDVETIQVKARIRK